MRRVLKGLLLSKKKAFQLLLLVVTFLQGLKIGQAKQLHFAFLHWKKLTRNNLSWQSLNCIALTPVEQFC
ncbi:hypothetical protein AHAS_Ahas18G0126000 [Arachis hypogaea]